MAKKPKPVVIGAPYPKGYVPREPIPPPPGCWDEVLVARRKYVVCDMCGGLRAYNGPHGVHRSEDGMTQRNCLGEVVAQFVQETKHHDHT